MMTFVFNQGGLNIRLCTKLYKLSTEWRGIRRNTVTDLAKSLEEDLLFCCLNKFSSIEIAVVSNGYKKTIYFCKWVSLITHS